MDNQPINFAICQVCKKEPAIYGDGLTWSRCAGCQADYLKEKQILEPDQAPTPTAEGFSHKLVNGLISIIMPIYNVNYSLFHYTGNAIGAVRAHSKKGDYELIIVDNGSPVEPPSLASYYAEKVIVWDDNQGVTKAWNAGIRASFGEYIVLLNNDTQVYEGWLEDMKKCLDAGLDLVMATPMYSLTEPFARWVEAEKIRDRWIDKPIQESFSDFKDFSCVMFKKSLLDDLGMFDEQFFNYAQDTDLLKRMDQAGYKYASTKAVAIHHIIDATGNCIPDTDQIMNQDKLKFKEKYNKPQAVEAVGPTLPIATPPVNLNLIKTNFTGDKIFLVIKDETHWIKNPETLAALGGGFDLVKTVEREEFNKFFKGEDIDIANVGKYAQI